jgi:hypothetical protein
MTTRETNPKSDVETRSQRILAKAKVYAAHRKEEAAAARRQANAMLKADRNCELTPAYREANKAANKLERLAIRFGAKWHRVRAARESMSATV